MRKQENYDEKMRDGTSIICVKVIGQNEFFTCILYESSKKILARFIQKNTKERKVLTILRLDYYL